MVKFIWSLVLLSLGLLLFSSAVSALPGPDEFEVLFCFPDVDGDGFVDGAPVHNGALNAPDNYMRRSYFSPLAFAVLRLPHEGPSNWQVCGSTNASNCIVDNLASRPGGNITPVRHYFTYNTSYDYIYDRYESVHSSSLSPSSSPNSLFYDFYSEYAALGLVYNVSGSSNNNSNLWTFNVAEYRWSDMHNDVVPVTCNWIYEEYIAPRPTSLHTGLPVNFKEYYGSTSGVERSDLFCRQRYTGFPNKNYQYLVDRTFSGFSNGDPYSPLLAVNHFRDLRWSLDGSNVDACHFDCNDNTPMFSPGSSNEFFNCNGYQEYVNTCSPDSAGTGLGDPNRGFNITHTYQDVEYAELFSNALAVEDTACYDNFPCVTKESVDPIVACNAVPYDVYEWFTSGGVGPGMTVYEPVNSSPFPEAQAALYSTEEACADAGFRWEESGFISIPASFKTGHGPTTQDTLNDISDACTGAFRCSDIEDEFQCNALPTCSFANSRCFSDLSSSPNPQLVASSINHEASGSFYYSPRVEDTVSFEGPNLFSCAKYFQDELGCAADAPTVCSTVASERRGYGVFNSSMTFLMSDSCVPEYRFVSSVFTSGSDCFPNDPTRSDCLCIQDADDDGFYVPVSNSFLNQCDVGDVHASLNPPLPPYDLTDLPSWNTALGNLHEPLGVGNIWDVDDSDPVLTYLDCPTPGEEFAYLRTEVVRLLPNGSLPEKHFAGTINDQPWGEYPAKFFGACCAGDNCLQIDISYLLTVPLEGAGWDNSALCVPPETVWSGHPYMGPNFDSAIMCSPGDTNLTIDPALVAQGVSTVGAWLDADVDPFVCEELFGHDWLASGFNASRLSSFSASDTPEYYEAFPLFMACCQDDGSVMINTTCDGSTTDTPLCAPHSGYRISSGNAVLATQCPDIMRVPPVTVDAPLDDSFLGTFDSLLQAQGSGYCCDGTSVDINDPNKPLCTADAGRVCYVSNQSISGVSLSPVHPQTEWCIREGPDPFCVLDDSVLDFAEVCEFDSQVCDAITQAVFTLPAPEPYVYRDYTTAVSSHTCYPALNYSSCTVVDNTRGCFEETVQRCEPDPLATCYAVCYTDVDSGEPICEEMCERYICEGVSTFRGPGCVIDPGCAVDVCVDEVTIDWYDEGSGFELTDCPDGEHCYWDEAEMDTGFQQYLTDPSSGSSVMVLERLSYTCEGEDYCLVQGSSSTHCVAPADPLGNPIYLEFSSSGDRFFCSDPTDVDSSAPEQNFGDYWCPLGWVFTNGECQPEENVCAVGVNGVYDFDCRDIASASDDPFWSQYNAGCVERVDNNPSFPNRYDTSCCFDSVTNNVEFFSQGFESQFIRTY